ncbi:PAS domain-containing protein [Rhodopirellula halodulae]|uniref:PAS domain-containing protein n=1 Tax=Rhodopirellula halodulae TaxID=2894198 RepID=UPI001E5C50E5|nr:PAS domain-containing protein [Rhodopirellula sp. JC737]MCC9657487.1 PAS domain-containing protein [Rhodopirellula sp. JC737]
MKHSFLPLLAIMDVDLRLMTVNIAFAQEYAGTLRVSSGSPSGEGNHESSLTDAFIGRPIQEVLSGDCFEVMRPHFELAISGERTTQLITDTDSGSIVYREVSYDPQYQDGAVTGVIVVAVDVTEDRLRESELHESNEFARAFLESSPDCVKVLDDQGQLLSMNVKGMCLMEIEDFEPYYQRPWWSYWPEQSQPFVRRAIADAKEFGEGSFEAECATAKGNPKWWDVIVTPIRNDTGEVKHFVAVSRDITVKRLHKEELREREEQLRRVIDNMNSFVGIIRCDGRLMEANQAAVDAGGVQRDQVIGALFWETPWWSHDAQVAEQMKSAFEAACKGEPSRFDVSYCSFESVARMVDISFVPVKDELGEFSSVIVSGFDVTDRYDFEQSLRKATDAAEQANRAKSQFLASMSHEIRTPMTSILGYSELILDKQIDEETRSYVSTIQRNGDFLLGLINDILDLSKIEADRMELYEESFDLVNLVEDVREIMQVRAREKNLELRVQYCGDPPRWIKADAKRLRQILVNLVGNAVKFTHRGHVRVQVHYEQAPEELDGKELDGDVQQLRFDIVDTGIGISEERLGKLFQPFSQGDPTVVRNFGGTGLGLVISQRLAAMLGGEIQVRSKDGEGSCFSFRMRAIAVTETSDDDLGGADTIAAEAINRVDEPQPVMVGSIANRVVGSQELQCNVLVADDRRDIRFLLNRILSQAGATVDEVEDGQQAVHWVTHKMESGGMPDLVVLDMQMPNLDGFEATRTLRRIGYTGAIIALTADAMDGDRRRCLECGCDEYMSKPVDSATLLEKVTRLVVDPSPDKPAV